MGHIIYIPAGDGGSGTEVAAPSTVLEGLEQRRAVYAQQLDKAKVTYTRIGISDVMCAVVTL